MGVGRLQWQGHGIMHPGANAIGLQILQHPVAPLNLDHIEVINVAGILMTQDGGDLIDASKQGIVMGGDILAGLGPSWQMGSVSV